MKAGSVFLGIVALFYLAAFVLKPEAGLAALSTAGMTLKTIAPVLVAVFFLTALLNTFVKPKSIARHIGRKRGLRGYVIAVAGGVLSHGPAYVWYPVLADLRNHGAHNGLVVAFLYARAVKLPWLPVMVSYFGLPFTLLLCFYILLGAWLQGMLAEKLLK